MNIPFIKRNEHHLIGIEFALDQAHFVQFKRNANGALTAGSVASINYPNTRDEALTSPTFLKPFIKRALQQGRFRGRRVCTAMPADRFQMLTVTYNRERYDSDAAAVVAVLGDRIEGHLKDYVVDYVPIRSEKNDDNQLAIAIVVPRERVLAHLELLRKSGIKVQHLEVGPTAIRRLVAQIAGPRERNMLMINFGGQRSFLTLFSGRRLLFDQEIEIGEDLIVDAVSEALRLDKQEAQSTVRNYGVLKRGEHEIGEVIAEIIRPILARLVQQVQRALLFAASESKGEQIHELIIVGSVARWPGVVDELSGFLNMPVVTIDDPHHGLGTTTDVERAKPELAVAVGLALRETAA